MQNSKLLAYYLPQFHPIPENDLWWGKGYTEWTNVAKAKPLFRNHYQPRIPADLGFYDLRLSQTREQQAEMAREAGVYGFCYWHYYFGGGKRLLELPFNEVLASEKLDFPFCLAWANHSWENKTWSKDGKNKMLIEQKYGGMEDYKLHFEMLKQAFCDKRYIKIDGKPLFSIFSVNNWNVAEFLEIWNKLINESKIAEKFYFVARIDGEPATDKVLSLGFDAVTLEPASRYSRFNHESIFQKILNRISRYFMQKPTIVEYSKIISKLSNENFDIKENVIPFILPNWDHSPRSGIHSFVLHNSTPELFRKHLQNVFEIVKRKENKLIFLKSWNEWAEGNYMEPDLKFGNGYLEALRDVLREVQ